MSNLFATEVKWSDKRLTPVKKTKKKVYHPPQPDNNILFNKTN